MRKIEYERPVLVDLSTIPGAYGTTCNPGTAAGPTCLEGSTAQKMCNNGSAAGTNCSNGINGIGGTTTSDYIPNKRRSTRMR